VQKVHTWPIKRPRVGFNTRAKEQQKASLVWRTGLSGVPPDMSGAPGDSNFDCSASGISRGHSAKIHRTVWCAPDSVRCSKGDRPQELASLGFSLQPLRYNSPDCPVHLRSNGYFRRQRLPAAHLLRASARRGQARPCRRTGQ
jgi:hypothetical protein